MAVYIHFRSVVRLLVIFLALGVATSSLAQVSVFVRSTAKDQIGRQLAFELREGIRKSAGLSLADHQKDARIHARLVTLDPDESDSSGRSTVYSFIITFQTFHDDPVEMYLTSWVGTCGRNAVARCAKGLVADIDQQANDIKSIIRDAMDSSRK